MRAPPLVWHVVQRVLGPAARGAQVMLAAATAAASLSCSLAVQAQVIAPVIVELPATARLATVSVTNTSGRAVRYQTEVLAWTQRDGADQHEPSRELLVVPPIADVAPGATQIFRIAPRLRGASGERAYRFVIEDITDASDDGGLSVALRLRHSLPVFVAAAGVAGAGAAPRVMLGPCAKQASPGCVRVSNAGDRHVAIAALRLDGAGWHADVRPGAARVLAGSWMEWLAEVPADAAHPVSVRVSSSVGPLAAAFARPDAAAESTADAAQPGAGLRDAGPRDAVPLGAVPLGAVPLDTGPLGAAAPAPRRN
jgi:fimbrial chaperone protein